MWLICVPRICLNTVGISAAPAVSIQQSVCTLLTVSPTLSVYTLLTLTHPFSWKPFRHCSRSTGLGMGWWWGLWYDDGVWGWGRGDGGGGVWGGERAKLDSPWVSLKSWQIIQPTNSLVCLPWNCWAIISDVCLQGTVEEEVVVLTPPDPRPAVVVQPRQLEHVTATLKLQLAEERLGVENLGGTMLKSIKWNQEKVDGSSQYTMSFLPGARGTWGYRTWPPGCPHSCLPQGWETPWLLLQAGCSPHPPFTTLVSASQMYLDLMPCGWYTESCHSVLSLSPAWWGQRQWRGASTAGASCSTVPPSPPSP